MKKTEVNQLVNKIKGYYNSQFFVDDYVLDAWFEQLEQYDYEDAEEHIKEYVKDYPDIAPKPHTFTKGLLTKKQKKELENANYTIECNLCHRWMPISEYDNHYEKCLDIQYLVSIAKQKGELYTREDLENCRDEVINKLLSKYDPTKINLKLDLKMHD